MKNIEFMKKLRDCVDLKSLKENNVITEEKRKLYYIQTEKAANLLLNQIGDKKFPVDINKIINFFGINAVSSNFDDIDVSVFGNSDFSNNKFHTIILFDERTKNKVYKSAKNKVYKNGIINLLINESDSDKIARMTVLSSIGLLIWGYKWNNTEFFNFLYSNNKVNEVDDVDDVDDVDESDSINELTYIYHSFARNVLMPEKEITKINKHYLKMHISDDERIKKISDFFGVDEREVQKKLYYISKYEVCREVIC